MLKLQKKIPSTNKLALFWKNWNKIIDCILYKFMFFFSISQNDPKQKNRREDDIIAYTFRQFVDGPFSDDPEIVVLLPMVKV